MHASPAAVTERIHVGAALSREPAEGLERNAGEPARRLGRMAGVLWLMVIGTGMFAFMAQSTLIVRGDAAATAARIMEAETQFRLGLAANLLAGAFYLGVTVLLYALLKPVSRSLSLLAASLGVAGVAAGAAASVTQLAPMVLLSQAAYLAAFTPEQLRGLAHAFLGVNEQAFGITMLFFGVQIAVLGYLIVRSSFLPRILGVLLALGGASYVISSLAVIIAPAFGARLAPFIVPAALIGEGSLCLWLIVKGLDGPGWQEQAAR